MQDEEISAIGCWPCRSGNINYSLRVPFGGYVSGQSLPYSLHIQNHSMTDIKGYIIEFIEYVTYYADRPEENDNEDSEVIVTEEYTDKCLRLSNRQFDGEIEIPSLPSDTSGRGIIHIEHGLRIEILLGACHSNKSISLPIVLGNVPIRESLEPRRMPSPMPFSSMLMESSDDESDTELPAPSAPLVTSSSDEETETDMPPAYEDLSEINLIFKYLRYKNFLIFNYRTTVF